MSKHTAGPWTIRPNSGTAVNAGKKHIAMVNFFKTHDAAESVYGEEHDANALLIASAPELLETLRHIAGAAMDITCERLTIRDAARAAIAKATGEPA